MKTIPDGAAVVAFWQATTQLGHLLYRASVLGLDGDGDAAELAQAVQGLHAAVVAVGGLPALERWAAVARDGTAVALIRLGAAASAAAVRGLFDQLTPGRWQDLFVAVGELRAVVDAGFPPIRLVGPDPAAVEWSRPEGPALWGKVFGRSAKTIPALFAAGKVRNKRLGPKSYMVDLADVPQAWREQARRATRRPPK
jgi:hypothetical protein